MTMPNERTKSLIFAVEFLLNLQSGDDVPNEIRENANHILRHFPSSSSILNEARRQKTQQEKDGLPAWLLPLDYYP